MCCTWCDLCCEVEDEAFWSETRPGSACFGIWAYIIALHLLLILPGEALYCVGRQEALYQIYLAGVIMVPIAVCMLCCFPFCYIWLCQCYVNSCYPDPDDNKACTGTVKYIILVPTVILIFIHIAVLFGCGFGLKF